MTRLEILCQLHGVQGGTIHQYDRAYSCDFIGMSDNDFSLMLNWLAYHALDSKFIE